MSSLNVRIVSEETIKPSSPTPPHLRIHKLSCMDQASPPRYMPALFSYPTNHDSSQTSSQTEVLEKLRSSLSTTLNHYYPFAGRFRDDGVSVECNGHGVPFVVASVEGDNADMSSVLESPDEDRLVQLIPCHPQQRLTDTNGELFLLAVRVNFFKCGGIAVAICAWHGVADASSLCCFAQAWAAICRGDPRVYGLLKGAVVDCSSLFPPQDSLSRGAMLNYHKQPSDSNNSSSQTAAVSVAAATSMVIVKRFVFPGSKITALRERIMISSGSRRLTRVEAISSLFWTATIRVAEQKRKEKKEEGHRFHSAVMVVNIRTRTSPPLPDVCMGNLIQPTVAVKWPMNDSGKKATLAGEDEETLLLGGLARKLGDAVRTVNPEHLKQLHENDSEGYLALTKSFAEEYAKEDFIMISSSCRYPFYQTDFGFGRPSSVQGFSRSNKTVVLLDARDGEGIEAWVTLDKDDMSMLEKDPSILHYAS
ncbi:unnamed protein product [Linum trigynum]|uniref:Uncharacterized protein n=1 Tax=Linum trigynum TaxID=586398 RepID=A0AAV2DVH2_9ROSI